MKIEITGDLGGVEPLYYFHKDKTFLHVERLSEIVTQQRFIKEINQDALALYFQFGYIPEPYSIYKNTFKLPAGHKLEYNPETNQLNIEKILGYLAGVCPA